MPRPDPTDPNRRPTRPRPRRRDALEQFTDQALQVLINRFDPPEQPTGLTILSDRYQLLVRTRQPHEHYARLDTDLLDPTTAWQAEVQLFTTTPDHLDIWFQIIPPDLQTRRHPRRPRTPPPPPAHQLPLDGLPQPPPTPEPDLTDPDPTDPIEPSGVEELPTPPADPDLTIRLHRLKHAFRSTDLRHVFNIIHAELHGCDNVTIRGRDQPTSRYYELSIATAKTGELVRHAARLNGHRLNYHRDRHLNIDAHSLDD